MTTPQIQNDSHVGVKLGGKFSQIREAPRSNMKVACIRSTGEEECPLPFIQTLVLLIEALCQRDDLIGHLK